MTSAFCGSATGMADSTGSPPAHEVGSSSNAKTKYGINSARRRDATSTQSEKAKRFRRYTRDSGIFCHRQRLGTRVLRGSWRGSAFPPWRPPAAPRPACFGRRDGMVTRAGRRSPMPARSWKRPICRFPSIWRRVSLTHRTAWPETIRLAAASGLVGGSDRGLQRRSAETAL